MQQVTYLKMVMLEIPVEMFLALNCVLTECVIYNIFLDNRLVCRKLLNICILCKNVTIIDLC